MAVGTTSAPSDRQDVLSQAVARAKAMPDLLVEAQRIANTVIAGWHGRKKAGPGENFWQFRPYLDGDNYARIDWRRSARDDHFYIRDREWESAQTVSLWCDVSPSMLYRSKFSESSKEKRAITLTLALAELLSRSGERIAMPALLPAFTARNGAERVAMALTQAEADQGLPDTNHIRRFSEVVLISDFLYPLDTLQQFGEKLAQRQIRAHLVRLMDPAEESFPFSGRTEFRDPESNVRLTAGRAETYVEDYRRLYQAHHEALAALCSQWGWSYTSHRSDGSPTVPLMHLHTMLSEARNITAGRNGGAA